MLLLQSWDNLSHSNLRRVSTVVKYLQNSNLEGRRLSYLFRGLANDGILIAVHGILQTVSWHAWCRYLIVKWSREEKNLNVMGSNTKVNVLLLLPADLGKKKLKKHFFHLGKFKVKICFYFSFLKILHIYLLLGYFLKSQPSFLKKTDQKILENNPGILISDGILILTASSLKLFTLDWEAELITTVRVPNTIRNKQVLFSA